MSELSDEKKDYTYSSHRRSASLFGPIFLIAIGLYFLLNNLGLISGLNWVAALQLWPLLLIFIGLNVIAQQAPGRLGTLLSALVGLAAVAVFGYVLLFAEDNVILNRLNSSRSGQVQTAPVEFAADDIESAAIEIDFGLPGADVYALEDSRNLIGGSVSYVGDLIFDTDVSAGKATVSLDVRNRNAWFNPGNWFNAGEQERWQIGLNPDVPMDLHFNIGVSGVDLDLSELTLSRLEIDGGAGSIVLALPDGDYDMKYDVGVGSSQIILPAGGQHNFDLDGGTGSIDLTLPPTMEARIEVDNGIGSFSLDEGRFRKVSGDDENEGVWETAGYGDGPNQLDMRIDVGAGSVSIHE